MLDQKFHEAAKTEIDRLFPNLGFIPVKDVGAFLSIAYQTTRHQLTAKTFPVENTKINGKVVVPSLALIDFYAKRLEQSGYIPQEIETTAESKAGRPEHKPEGEV